MKDQEGKLERVCFNCNSYMPASAKEPTEFGICLEDAEFEPFVEEILENLNFDSCHELIERKKFLGDREACPDFEESECFEIDDESPLGRELMRLSREGKLDLETFEAALLSDQVSRIDFKALPVDRHSAELRSPEPARRQAAASTLGGYISLGNQAAFDSLLEFFLALPAPETIEEVHWKKEILRHLDGWEDRPAVAPHLLEELYRLPSNNTTRQYIVDIFRFLERCPWDVIHEPLERMLSEKRFTARFKGKIEETLFHARRRSLP